MATRIKDEFMQHIAEESAWQDLSKSFAWTEALLEKHCEKVDWKKISENESIMWSIPMLHKFSKKVDWNLLSRQICKNYWFTEAHLEEFKDKWNWTEVTENIIYHEYLFTNEIIDKYIDYWNWDSLIKEGIPNNPIDFFNKYKDRISMSKLQNSSLWWDIINHTANKIKSEFLS